MEEKRRDAGGPPASTAEAHLGELSSTRRRTGAPKRKASALGTSSSPSLPSKRITREKHLISHSQIHNGPLTRARQVPAAGSALSSGHSRKIEEKASAAALEVLEAEEARKAIQAWEALEAATEAEFEALRSRERTAHVVPNHCGWFSWTKVHSLEERALPSFFNGKSENRTPELYMEIRNWIMEKFHRNPDVQIESKDLSELEAGDLDARQDILEFLDYWGLINFHPFPPVDATMAEADNGEAVKKESLIEQLYHFETVQPCHPVAPKNNLTTPAFPSGLFSESAIAEELVKPEGPSVEYHCNSCSGDCSRKRYHCQKQADFDLCLECFNNGKFGSGMSASDFILMEPAEIHGVAGGTWTDQETLLLLEALELYKENWNEIAEHVATKTKAQCILHFVQMPIEDVFLDSEIDTDATLKENSDSARTDNNISNPKEAPEARESKGDPGEGQTQNSPMENPTEEDADKIEVEDTVSKEEDNNLKVGEDDLKLTSVTEVKPTEERHENCAIKALREAFEALGYFPTPENPLSFAEVGNPVMALAGFLARLTGSDIVTASARSSLKSLKCESPGMQLALKHCFLLEDPPDYKKEPTDSHCVGTETIGMDDQKILNKERNQKEDGGSSVVDGKEITNDKNNPASQDTESSEKPDSATAPVEQCNLNDPGSSELQEDQASVVHKESGGSASEEKLLGEDSKGQDGSQPPGGEKNVDMVIDSVPSASEAADPVKADTVPRDEDMESNSLPSDKDEKRNSPSDEPDQDKSSARESKDISDSMPSEENGVNGLQNGATDNPSKDQTKEEQEPADERDDHNLDKVKQAAISALSAAAVKAKVLADYEEDQIRQLTLLLMEKQLHKLETKLAFFNEMDNVTARVREQLDRSRQRLYHERAQIIAARLGIPASSSRPMPPQTTLPANRMPMNFANLAPRAPTSMPPQRPPLARPPMGTLPPNPSFGNFNMASQSGQASR